MFTRNSILGSMPPVVKNLIITNVIVYLITMISGNFMYEHFALYCFQSEDFRPFQLVTHMFMHGDFAHIFFNMYALFLFGSILERVWGSQKFLLYYFATGIGAALFHLGVISLEIYGYLPEASAGDLFARTQIAVALNTQSVGASGAVYGLLLAYGMLFPNNVIQLIFPPVALKAKWFVLIYGAIELLLGLSGKGSNIAHFAHLGGMIFGFFLILYWKKNNRMYY